MRVFISYKKSETKEIAEAISLCLVSDGNRVFLDENSLPIGGTFDNRIRKAVKDSDLFIFLLSPGAVREGSYTLTELEFARKKWRNPEGHIITVEALPTDFTTVPAYLKAINVLKPKGNVAAEVCGVVAEMSASKRKARKNYVALLGVILTLVFIYFAFNTKLLSSLNFSEPYVQESLSAQSNNGSRLNDSNINITVESANSGEQHDLTINRGATIEYLSKKAQEKFDLTENATTRSFLPFMVRWVVVDKLAVDHWEELPRYRQRELFGLFLIDDEYKYILDEDQKLEDFNITDGIIVYLYAIEDERMLPPVNIETPDIIP